MLNSRPNFICKMNELKPSEMGVGIVGLGLMGSSIAVSLLLAGHHVVAIAPTVEDRDLGPLRVGDCLIQCGKSGLLAAAPEHYLAQLTITEDYGLLAECRLALECVIERLEVKRSVFANIAACVSPTAVIGSNTSAIPISTLQTYVSHPERFLGIHWAEPAYLTRFLEITCGNHTAPEYAEWTMALACHWGKEPTLLRRDLRGFITNRLMYAVYREMFHLMAEGKATMADVDKAFRYDAGSWMTLIGIFRRMDYVGLNEYSETLTRLMPQLSNSDEVPVLMQDMVETNARGVHNNRGLYEYAPGEAQRWEEAFARFNREIYRLARQYPASQPENQP